MLIVAMIPARMGSQRLKQKNLQTIGGVPLITRAIRKCKESGVFDQIWVNSEHPKFGEIAKEEGVSYHKRPEALGNNQATSEQFILEFLEAHACDYIFQVHSIAPVLTADGVRVFVNSMLKSDCDVGLSAVNEQIECAMNGRPVNFSFDCKTNSQELTPVQRITWSITGWKRSVYLEAARAGKCATYAGKVGIFPVDRMSGHIIKTEADLRIAEALYADCERNAFNEALQ
jgi:CMP-N-acetylneuraminic acid synthetase